ncbi:hypothetical protein BDZ91DRAFT_36972 [Kalaharituber pfeilii]|nr:hypothetical protein BDZ91DRAFT_36972 [Kalaharituber pfeilii]
MVPPLATELQRVATAPYAVSLKTLHDLLTAPSPAAIISFSITESIHLWATSHACLLPSLACSVVTSLEFCPFAQRVLEILAKERGIRDAILKHKRSFLEGVLKSAMSTDSILPLRSPSSITRSHKPSPSLLS